MTNDEIHIENEMTDTEQDSAHLESLPAPTADRRLDDPLYVRNMLEAILLVSPEPVNAEQVAKSLKIESSVLDDALEMLSGDYSNRGVQIRHVAGGIELTTNPDVAEHLECYLQLERKRKISRAGLQALSIIAYNQPLTRTEIESFRGGINSDGVLDSLLERNLIKIAGRKDTPGTPYLYSVSDDFLKYFGLNDIDELKEILPPIGADISNNIDDVKLHELGIVIGSVSDDNGNLNATENEIPEDEKNENILIEEQDSSTLEHSPEDIS